MLKSLFTGKNIHRGSALRNTLQSKEVYFVKSLIINSKHISEVLFSNEAPESAGY